ncbi:Uncharacterised protein [Bordetella pertussis]|nr:Uncharacterised protein [Bordetella pertussis]CPJ30717.1 Uncharacterised protein [Bordetella pertussis]CPJ55379.1 Uncharacterised protein [Bordetella pertussis]CPK36761.1 Uncharacterised protein [Bordetella pertussis]CPM43084.1 Uncharacterised protein [Bordetella pertussis]
MMASVPVEALATAPETGASISVRPRAASCSDRRRVSAGLDEPMSTMAAPDSSRSISPGWPSPPSTTALVMALLGNMVITVSQAASSCRPAAARRRLPQAGWPASRSNGAGERS